MKKIISLLLAATMILALAIPAFAAEAPAEAFAKRLFNGDLSTQALVEELTDVMPGDITYTVVKLAAQTEDEEDVYYAAAAQAEFEGKDLEKKNDEKKDLWSYSFKPYGAKAGQKITLDAVVKNSVTTYEASYANAVGKLFTKAQIFEALEKLFGLNENAAKEVVKGLVEADVIREYNNGYLVQFVATPDVEIEAYGPITEGNTTSYYFVNLNNGEVKTVDKVKEVKAEGKTFTATNATKWSDFKYKSLSLSAAADEEQEDKTFKAVYPKTIEIDGTIYYFTGTQTNPVYRAFPTFGTKVELTMKSGKIDEFDRYGVNRLPKGLEKVKPAAAEEETKEGELKLVEITETEKLAAVKKVLATNTKAFKAYTVEASEGVTKGNATVELEDAYAVAGLHLYKVVNGKSTDITKDALKVEKKTATVAVDDITATYVLAVLEGSPKTSDSTVVFSLIPAMALCVAAPVVLFARKKED